MRILPDTAERKPRHPSSRGQPVAAGPLRDIFAYGGPYFDANMKPLINSAAAVRALDELVKTMAFYPPGVLLFESEETKTKAK